MISERKVAVLFGLIFQLHKRHVSNLQSVMFFLWVCGNACVYVSFWLLLLVCVGDLFWHISCAVEAYCVWVITCHRKPWALLASQSHHCCCFSLCSHCFFLTPATLFLSYCLSLLPISHFLLCFECVNLSRKVISGYWSWWFLWSVYFMYFFHFCSSQKHSTTKQPVEVFIKFLPGLAAASICKTCNNQVQRWCWWQVHWQSPFTWAIHFTAWKTTWCFCLVGALGAHCALGMMVPLPIAFWIVWFHFIYIIFVFFCFTVFFTVYLQVDNMGWMHKVYCIWFMFSETFNKV